MRIIRRAQDVGTSSLFASLLLLTTFGSRPVQGADVLKTNGFTTCLVTDEIKVTRMNIEYSKKTNEVTFDLAGISAKEQYVMAELRVTAYGKEVYTETFDPCEKDIKALCPIPKGDYAAVDQYPIPAEFVSKIPAIAFQIPDLDGLAHLVLKAKEGGKELACLESVVENGKTMSLPSVSAVTAGVAAAALGVSALSAAAGGGAGTGTSPGFIDVMTWFQFVAMTGMNSVEYPSVYRSFSNNFGWSTGMIPWEQMQVSIDNFRKGTGGNTTRSSVEALKNSTLIFTNTSGGTPSVAKRALDWTIRNVARAVTVDGETVAELGGNGEPKEDPAEKNMIQRQVDGVTAYVERLKIPDTNTFMTVLLVFCIVIATVAVCILLFKVILEAWALFASFPVALRGFRKRYWEFLATTIVRIIFVLYGTWTLYCLYQFSHGDAWGAHVLAAITLAMFTGVLGFFVVKIFLVAREAKKTLGGAEALYEDKPKMRKYGLFYDQFKSNFWWLFIPMILYAFAKASFIALGEGHGMIQVAGQLAVEGIMLIILLWSRPYNTKTGNVLNIIISVVRVLSVVCLLVFVQQLGIARDTKTVTGVALIVIQSVLTAALAILIICNAIFVMCKKDPKKPKKGEFEKMQDDEPNLTPLDPRNSLLIRVPGSDGKGFYQKTPTQDSFLPPGNGKGAFGDDAFQMTEYRGGREGFHDRNASVDTLGDRRDPAGSGYRGGSPPQGGYRY
ncbi:TRP-domain-containing protein [Ascobolus immersus RN42]|uniref:TRP-domain-containing protein n=1 Tax=Ascobolus immersus RN42 TaxID=1160509 RepID=A0A3N4HSZ1_ASCIM|nr:TRP-domain-containing protein [Ascobolus immersus RN42]